MVLDFAIPIHLFFTCLLIPHPRDLQVKFKSARNNFIRKSRLHVPAQMFIKYGNYVTRIFWVLQWVPSLKLIGLITFFLLVGLLIGDT